MLAQRVTRLLILLMLLAVLSPCGQAQTSPCDVDFSGTVDIFDVQFMFLEASYFPINDLNGDGVLNVVDIQIDINAALGLGCAIAAPQLVSIVPNTGQQGLQNLSVDITGQATHFQQDSTFADFGAGVTVGSLTINSATSATAALYIDPAAATGARNVSLYTGTETATLNNGFTVTVGTTGLTSVNPNTGQQGQQNLSINISGLNTHFAQNTTVANFGASITVGALTIYSPTSATAVLNIDPAAATGARNVSLITGTETATLNNGFTVTAGTPVLTLVNPNTGQEGQTGLSVTITGNFTHFSMSSVVAFSGTGITAGAPTAATATSLTVSLTIAGNAPLGAQGVQVTTGTETVSLAGAFTVAPPPPPTITVNTPAPGSKITQPADLYVTITDNAQGGPAITWTVTLVRINTNGGLQIGSGTGSVANQKVGTIDPTILANDTYTVNIAVNKNGVITTGQFNFDVTTTNLKLGNYTTTVADISTQIAGLTITLLRVYDSLDVSQGDFGAGWRLQLPGRVSDSAPADGPFTTTTRAYVTRPDGHSEGFTFSSVPQTLGFGNDPIFIPDPGVTDTLIPPSATIFCGSNGCHDFFGDPYHPTNFVLQTKDKFQYTIDEFAGLQQIEDPGGNTITVTSTGLVSSTGTSVPFTRDSQGRITSIQGPGAGPNPPKVTYAYDANGNLVSFVDQLNNQTQYFYENASFPHYLTRVLDPLGRPMTRNVFDATGHLIASCNANGNVTTLAGCTTFSQNTVALTQTIISPRGFREDFFLDANGNVLIDRHYLDGMNYLDTVRTYDASNNKLTEKDPAGNVTKYTYDSHGNVLTVTDPGNRTTTYTYNTTCNQVASTTDPAGHVTRSTFDGNCDVLTDVDALGHTATYQYNSLGELTSSTDALGNQRTWNYDASGLLTQSTDPFGSTITFQYDSSGYLVSRTDRNGRRIDYQYDAAHRLTQETWNTNPPRVTTYTYDAAGEITGGASPDYSLALTYDQLGRQITADNQGTPGATRVVLTYSYDADDNITTIQDSLGGSTQYTYDALGRETQLVQTGTGVSPKSLSLVYDTASLLSQVKRFADAAGNSPVANTSFQYDCGGCADRVTGIQHVRASDSAALDTLTYALDAAGNITSSTDTEGSHQYTYDAGDRLLTATHTPAAIQPNEFYTYDAIGNRLTSHRSASYTLSYMGGGKGTRLLSDAQYTYVYDAEGNLTRRTSKADSSHTDFTWDYLNRLTSMVQTSGGGTQISSETYLYDLSGRRIRVVRPGGMEQYYYSGVNPVLVLDGSGNVSSRNLYGSQVDELYAQEQTGQTNWTLVDRADSVRDTISNTPTVLNHFAYDSFGDLKAHSGPVAATQTLFIGREFSTSPLTGYFRARYYSPDIGRFLSEDSLVPYDYSYAGNNPCSLTDPLGLDEAEEGVLQKFATSVGRYIKSCGIGLFIAGGLAVSAMNPGVAQAEIKAIQKIYSIYLQRRKKCDLGPVYKILPYK